MRGLSVTVCGQASSCFLPLVVERDQAGQVSSRAGPLLAWKILKTEDGPEAPAGLLMVRWLTMNLERSTGLYMYVKVFLLWPKFSLNKYVFPPCVARLDISYPSSVRLSWYCHGRSSPYNAARRNVPGLRDSWRYSCQTKLELTRFFLYHLCSENPFECIRDLKTAWNRSGWPTPRCLLNQEPWSGNPLLWLLIKPPRRSIVLVSDFFLLPLQLRIYGVSVVLYFLFFVFKNLIKKTLFFLTACMYLGLLPKQLVKRNLRQQATQVSKQISHTQRKPNLLWRKD